MPVIEVVAVSLTVLSYLVWGWVLHWGVTRQAVPLSKKAGVSAAAGTLSLIAIIGWLLVGRSPAVIVLAAYLAAYGGINLALLAATSKRARTLMFTSPIQTIVLITLIGAQLLFGAVLWTATIQHA
jgi:hypothetical protein